MTGKFRGWKFAGILAFLLAAHPATCSAGEADSLQLRLFHGLDELGASEAFFFAAESGDYRSSWSSSASTLYRRPQGTFGELKYTGWFKACIARSLRGNFEIRTVFDADGYQLQRFTGPEPRIPSVLPPPLDFDLADLNPATVSPPQQINRSSLGLGAAFKPDTLLELTTLIGQQWEYREGYDDRGLTASLAADLTGLEYRGYRNDLDVFLEQEQLGNRTNQELRFSYGLDKRFSNVSSDRLEIYYRRKRYDYHLWGTSSIGTRVDLDQRLRNRLQYDMFDNLGFVIDTELWGSTREIRTPSSSSLREEINTANAVTLRGNRDRFGGYTRMKFDWGAQEDVTGLKKERGTSLEGALSWYPSDFDSLAFFSAVRKRQYDTSDTANYDDRDRLRYEVSVTYLRRFSPAFTALFRAETALEHLVYIYAEKSDQNHWNRIFKLKPEITFRPAADWHNTASFELVANTTSYDFELDPANIKSTIYRRYTAADSAAWSIARGWAMSVEYALDLEDGGRFLWDEWIQQISEEYRTQRGSLRFIRQTRSGIRLQAGISFYRRQGWEYTVDPSAGTVKSPFFHLSRWGPLLQLYYSSASGIRLTADGDLSWVHEWNREDYTIINLDLRVTWR